MRAALGIRKRILSVSNSQTLYAQRVRVFRRNMDVLAVAITEMGTPGDKRDYHNMPLEIGSYQQLFP